jgi:hypothetical protein
VSFLRRLEPFLYSRKNIAGSLLALGGLALYFVGITSGPIGLGVIAGLYAIGYLLAPRERGVRLDLFSSIGNENENAQEVRVGLDRLLNSIHGRVADDIYRRVESIRDSIIVTLPRQGGGANIDEADPNVHLIRRTALAYLPQALDSYLAVPRFYAELRPVADGRTPHDVLLDQLNLMDQKMQEVAEDVVTHDSERLLAHGRFLQERFADSSLGLKRQQVPVAVGGDPEDYYPDRGDKPRII